MLIDPSIFLEGQYNLQVTNANDYIIILTLYFLNSSDEVFKIILLFTISFHFCDNVGFLGKKDQKF